MVKLTLFICAIFVIFQLTRSAPFFETERPKYCYDRECPSGTVACRKHTKTTLDKTNLDVTVTCLDAADYSLKDFHEKLPNTYGPNTHYESTSYAGSYIYRTHGVPKVTNTIVGNNDVETF